MDGIAREMKASPLNRYSSLDWCISLLLLFLPTGLSMPHHLNSFSRNLLRNLNSRYTSGNGKKSCFRKWFGNEQKKLHIASVTMVFFSSFPFAAVFCLLFFFCCCLRISHENVHFYSWHFVWNYEKYTNANIFTWVVIERRMMIKCMHKSDGMCLPCAKAFTVPNKRNK